MVAEVVLGKTSLSPAIRASVWGSLRYPHTLRNVLVVWQHDRSIEWQSRSLYQFIMYCVTFELLCSSGWLGLEHYGMPAKHKQYTPHPV